MSNVVKFPNGEKQEGSEELMTLNDDPCDEFYPEQRVNITIVPPEPQTPGFWSQFIFGSVLALIVISLIKFIIGA